MNIPKFLIPWIDRFYEPLEIDLLRILSTKPLEKDHILELLGKKQSLKDFKNFDRFLKRAWQRGVVKFLDDSRIAPEDFHIRLDYWVLFEGWKDLPVEIKSKLNDWELNHYIASHCQRAEEMKNGQQSGRSQRKLLYDLLWC